MDVCSSAASEENPDWIAPTGNLRPPRIVILTQESVFTNIIVETLMRELPGQIAGIVRFTGFIRGESLTEFLSFLRRRCGFLYATRLVLQVMQCDMAATVARFLKRRPAVRSLEAIQAHDGIPVIDASDVNSPATTAHIHALQPCLIISIYLPQLIREPLIDLPALGVINLHPALLPRHRGLFPLFGVIASGDVETGVTVHWVDRQFDTGDVLLQEKFATSSEDSMLSLTHKCSIAGGQALVKAVGLIEKGTAPRIPQDETKATYQSWPSAADQQRFREAGGRDGSLRELWRYL